MLAPPPIARPTAFHRPGSFPPAEFQPHQRAEGGGLWTGSAGNRCLPCSPGQPFLAASEAHSTSSGLAPLFPNLVFSLHSALRPPLSHPKETCLRATFFDHPVLRRYSLPQCSIVSSVTLIVICSYFIYLLVYLFCLCPSLNSKLSQSTSMSVLSLGCVPRAHTRRPAWRGT